MGSQISVFSNDSMGSRIFVHVAEDEIENIPLHEDIFDTDSEEDESEDEGSLDSGKHDHITFQII